VFGPHNIRGFFVVVVVAVVAVFEIAVVVVVVVGEFLLLHLGGVIKK
jgi:hypothetical protein